MIIGVWLYWHHGRPSTRCFHCKTTCFIGERARGGDRSHFFAFIKLWSEAFGTKGARAWRFECLEYQRRLGWKNVNFFQWTPHFSLSFVKDSLVELKRSDASPIFPSHTFRCASRRSHWKLRHPISAKAWWPCANRAAWYCVSEETEEGVFKWRESPAGRGRCRIQGIQSQTFDKPLMLSLGLKTVIGVWYSHYYRCRSWRRKLWWSQPTGMVSSRQTCK